MANFPDKSYLIPAIPWAHIPHIFMQGIIQEFCLNLL